MCGETYCKTCKEYVDDVHQRFMKPVDIENSFKKAKQTQYICFDFECTQSVRMRNGMVQGQMSSA